jgi:hypothetical protein
MKAIANQYIDPSENYDIFEFITNIDWVKLSNE